MSGCVVTVGLAYFPPNEEPYPVSMLRPARLAVIAAFSLMSLPALAADKAGSKDHPLIGRYTGSEITAYKVADFNEQRFVNAPLDIRTDGETFTDANSFMVEGKITDIRYDAPKERSALEIIRNYEDSLKSKGFEIIYSCANDTCFKGKTSVYRFNFVAGDEQINYRYEAGVRYLLAKAIRPTGDVYASVVVGESKGNPLVHVIAADLKPMQTDQIAFIDASAMAQAIAANGRVALYGIQFDFDKADIKEESRPTLDEIAKLMKASGDLSIVVTGHTDSKGAFDYNVDLSKRRAAAVVADLTKRYGIAAARLIPFGAGMAAPIAPNEDEAGRAKNRRVELVKR